jgi:fructan beta-fructosidase
MPDQVLYDETHRPQFHFTAQKNWINDPNGLVYYQGEYHLFFQHNPTSVLWGNMTWGHAISTDLVHWTQLEHALYPDDLGTIFSGSAVVDWHNTSGLQEGDEPPLIILYTSAGAHVPEPVPFTQSLAYSNDRGRTWEKYEGNPVLGHIKGSNRDPKIVWHKETNQWLMALYLEGAEYVLYGSVNLREWQHLCDLELPGVSECPDLFELPIDGDLQNTRWVYWGANGGYLLGHFDGAVYVPETEVFCAEHGPNGYAAQTWSDVAAADGRRIQIAWMRGGKYPAMPFNQQMSFPVELTLRTTPAGVRLCREPVREIEALQKKMHYGESAELSPGKPLRPDVEGDLFDIRLQLEPGEVHVVGVQIRGNDLRYDAVAQRLSFLGKEVELEMRDGSISLHLLVDRTSLEVFAHDGEVSMSFCFLPEAADVPLVFYAEGGVAQLRALELHELCSAWV